MAKKFSEITIVRSTKIGRRVVQEGQVLPVAELKEAEVNLLINLGKARPTVDADKADLKKKAATEKAAAEKKAAEKK